MMRLVDFHMHTTHSDGSYSPEELMRYCKEKNLACVSVTDHDTMSSFEACRKEAEKLEIELIPGVELSAIFEPGTLHILGYFLDRHNEELVRSLEEIQKARRERNPGIIEKLNSAGIDITMDEVLQEAFSGAASTVAAEHKQVGRPHFAKVLIKKGVVKDTKEAFSKYLGKGQCAYIDKRRISGREAVELINKAGGIASIAHPKTMMLNDADLDREIKKLADCGLGGIEVYNSCQDLADNGAYLKIAKKYNLVATAGSDFHGKQKPGVDLANYGIKMGYEMVDQLRAKIAKRT
jgi:3',5'-nucleoside bisphosphate phosphatase